MVVGVVKGDLAARDPEEVCICLIINVTCDKQYLQQGGLQANAKQKEWRCTKKQRSYYRREIRIDSDRQGEAWGKITLNESHSRHDLTPEAKQIPNPLLLGHCRCVCIGRGGEGVARNKVFV